MIISGGNCQKRTLMPEHLPFLSTLFFFHSLIDSVTRTQKKNKQNNKQTHTKRNNGQTRFLLRPVSKLRYTCKRFYVLSSRFFEARYFSSISRSQIILWRTCASATSLFPRWITRWQLMRTAIIVRVAKRMRNHVRTDERREIGRRKWEAGKEKIERRKGGNRKGERRK